MRRISVIGNSGVGKTTVARRIGEALDIPRLELDALMHQPGWEPLPNHEFRARVEDFTLQPSWVVDGNYTSHGISDIVWPRADTIVWLDLPRAVVMSQVVRRTLRRVTTRQVLWNGNREPFANLFDPRPEKNIIVWAWTRHRRTREKYERALTDGVWDHTSVHRLEDRYAVEHFLEATVSRQRS